MFKKYELNDLVTIKNNTGEITIRIFEIFESFNKKVRGINDYNNELYELVDNSSLKGKVFWAPCKFNHFKISSNFKNAFLEIEHITNQFSISVDKKSFTNLKNGFDANILKYEEIKLFSLNLYLPLDSSNLTSEKIVFLINKFIWGLEKTIPVDVYYQNLGCLDIEGKIFTSIKIAIFMPKELIKKVNGNIHYPGIAPKTPLLHLIKDVWLTVLRVQNVPINIKQNYLSEYYYYLPSVTYTHPISQLTEIVNKISFDFNSEKELRNNLISKLVKNIKESPKVNLDLIQFKVTFNQKGDVDKLLSLINKELECDLEIIKINENGVVEIAGTKVSKPTFKSVLRANDYSNYIYNLRDNTNLTNSDIAFDVIDIFVATDVLNFTFSKKEEINRVKTIAVVDDFIIYIINKELIAKEYTNKLTCFHYTE